MDQSSRTACTCHSSANCTGHCMGKRNDLPLNDFCLKTALLSNSALPGTVQQDRMHLCTFHSFCTGNCKGMCNL